MKLKLIKRPFLIYQFALFIILTPLFVHIIFSFSKERSVFDLMTLQLEQLKNYVLWAMTIILLYQISFFKKNSILVSYIYYALIFISVAGIYLNHFNKWCFLLLTLYTCLYFSMLLIWIDELKNPIINPLYSNDDLEYRPAYILPITILTNQKNKNYPIKIHGVLTNWNPEYAFIRLEESINDSIKYIELECFHFDLYFKSKGIIYSISKDKKGIGIKLKPLGEFSKSKLKNQDLNWENLVHILSARGIGPLLINV